MSLPGDAYAGGRPVWEDALPAPASGCDAFRILLSGPPVPCTCKPYAQTRRHIGPVEVSSATLIQRKATRLGGNSSQRVLT